MVRLVDPAAISAHLARFDVSRLSKDGLSPVDARRLDALLDRPYENLSSRDVAHALELVERLGIASPLFAYFLPAALRKPPERDLRSTERLIAGLVAARGDRTVSDWDPEIDATLSDWLLRRPLRGGDDPVDLWLSEPASRWADLDAARSLSKVARVRLGPGTGWAQAAEGPPYLRVALALLSRRPASAAERLSAWESAPEDNLRRAWVEVVFHAHGEGWRPEPASLAAFLSDPLRSAAAHALLSHPADDLALGAAAILALLDRPSLLARRAELDARLEKTASSADDRFVLVRSVRRLLAT